MHQQNDARLRPYVMARAIDGRVVDSADLARLRLANRTVDAVREMLPLGRGNVASDIERTRGESSRRSVACNAMTYQLIQMAGWPRVQARATAALFAQTGTCDEHAALGVMLHAPSLRPGEVLYQVTSSQIGHVWAEWRQEANPHSAFALVLDPWMDGPAVFASDGQLSDVQESTQSYFNFSQTSGLAAKARTDWLIASNGQGLAAMFFQANATVVPDYRWPPHLTYRGMPVISRAFELRVQTKLNRAVDIAKATRFGVSSDALAAPPSLQKARRSLLNDTLAVGVAREMKPGLSIRDAQKEVPGLLNGAKHQLRKSR
ncbi:hypothetical protein [Acidovorax sp. NCPPB 3576]|uniref:hypothetical protein n=1 Tax=Acidovorax sp. NCPPB 3576 TaxID=2940488 RepID=UPI00234B53E8|nr:hypothetical protein [Acidovorax sp. NCPPB 3576]WCM87138.1 hypothetical protein M5C98_17435 [Acidovorax sp. NCPPB 3576]